MSRAKSYRLLLILQMYLVIGTSIVLAESNNLNVNLIGRWSTGGLGYNDVWGYTDSTGREYAIIGTNAGTGIVEITDSTDVHLVTFINGPSSGWRDIKTWQHYAYVTTEASGGGIQIIDLSGLPDSATLVRTYNETVGDAHNLYIDEAGFAYICGATSSPSSSGGGLNILDLSDPVFPVEVGIYTVAGMHDVYVRNDTAYGAAGADRAVHIIDVSDKTRPTLISRFEYPSNYAHNTWTTEDGSYLLTTDETRGGHLQVFDVRDPFNVTPVGEYTANPDAIIHNAYVRGDLAYISYYTEGMRVVDISEPTFLVEVGFFDTSTRSPGSSAGDWGVYPFFPSGKIAVSDMQTGLYVFRFTGAGAQLGRVEGIVTNSQTGSPVEDVHVQIIETGIDVHTSADGSYRVGGFAGPITLAFSKRNNYSGFYPDTLQVTLESEVTIDGSIALTPFPSGSLSGHLTHSATGAPIPDALVKVDGTTLEVFSDTSGEYSFPLLLADTAYNVSALKFGFRPESYNITIGPNQEAVQDIALIRDFTDDAEVGFPWTVGSQEDDATFGLWERAIPLGVSLPIFGTPVQPESDHTLDGLFAYVTGPSNSLADNPDGRTTLTSPLFDVTDFGDPVINYFRWFYTNVPGEDFLRVEMSSNGGKTWSVLETVTEVENEWTHKFFRVSDFGSPTATMQIRFIVSDEGMLGLVEALMDDFSVTDGITVVDGDDSTIPRAYRLEQNYPNPFNPSTVIQYELPQVSDVSLSVFNLLGQEVARLVDERQEAGSYSVRFDGDKLSSGLYFYRLEAEPETVASQGSPLRGSDQRFVMTRKMLLVK